MRIFFTFLIAAIFSYSANSQTVLLTEDFSSGALPAGWSNVDNTGGGVWFFNNPGARNISTTTADNGFAIFDSDHLGDDGLAEEADLITPTFNCAPYDSLVNLQFSHYFYDGTIPTGATGAVEVSIDGGANWTQEALYETLNSGNGAVVDLDITASVLGASNVKVRFKYNGSWSYYWAVDDVSITGLIKAGSPAPATPPVAMRDEVECDSAASININVALNDSVKDHPIDETSTIIIDDANFGSTEVGQDGRVLYTPITGFTGVDSFSYKISDTANNASNIAYAVVTVVTPNANFITDNSIASSLQIYPNPASNKINLDLSKDELNKVQTIEIIDITGKVVLKSDLLETSISLPKNLEKGMYYVLVQGENLNLASKFLKN